MKTLTKPTLSQLLHACADVLLVHAHDIQDTKNTASKITECRYMVFAIMERAGYTHEKIAEFFKMNRESVTKALGKLDGWLKTYKDVQGTYNRLLVLVLKEV